MTAANDTLLVKFRSKDTRFGVTRRTVKALASELDVSETQVVHLALSRSAEGQGAGSSELVRMSARWPSPTVGDIVWCHFPELPTLEPGPKPRPALVLSVETREDGIAVTVAYGTSKKVTSLKAG